MEKIPCRILASCRWEIKNLVFLLPAVGPETRDIFYHHFVLFNEGVFHALYQLCSLDGRTLFLFSAQRALDPPNCILKV
jgi:hypothetical protein